MTPAQEMVNDDSPPPFHKGEQERINLIIMKIQLSLFFTQCNALISVIAANSSTLPSSAFVSEGK